MTTSVHRVEVLIVDTDDVGPDGVQDLLEDTRYPNRAISPQVMSVETREVEWSDEHPLNHTATQDGAYRALFGLGAAPAPLHPDRCTTHHAACDCREAATRAALDAADALAGAVSEEAGTRMEPWGWDEIRDALAAYRAARGAR